MDLRHCAVSNMKWRVSLKVEGSDQCIAVDGDLMIACTANWGAENGFGEENVFFAARTCRSSKRGRNDVHQASLRAAAALAALPKAPATPAPQSLALLIHQATKEGCQIKC